MTSNHPAIAQSIIVNFKKWIGWDCNEASFVENRGHYKFTATSDKINFNENNYLTVVSHLLLRSGQKQSDVLTFSINTFRFKQLAKKEQLLAVTQKLVDSISKDHPDLNFICKNEVGMVVISVSYKSIKEMDETDAKILCSIIKKLTDQDTIKNYFDVKMELNTPTEVIQYSQDIDEVAATLQTVLLDKYKIKLHKKENGDYAAEMTQEVAEALPNYTNQMSGLVRQLLGKTQADGGNGRYDIERYSVFVLNGIYIVLYYSRKDSCFVLTKKAYDFWF